MSRLTTLTSSLTKARLTRVLLVTSALASSLAIAGPALAADATATADQAAPTADQGGTLSQVVVTARKREENLQAVPVTASVLSGGALQQQNLLNFYDLRGALPDLMVNPSQGGTGTNLSIRGVGAAGGLVQQDVRLGLYVDDMFIARPEGNSLMFYDQSSLQVFYGPQGTLFGRNTSGGAVVITTTKPTSNGSSYLQATVGNFDTLNFEGGVNIPISDTLMTRFSFRTQSADGYITHVLDNGTSNNINDKSFRGQLRWLATDKLTVDLEYEHDESYTNGSARTITGCNPGGFPAGGYGLLTTGIYSGIPYCGGTLNGVTYPTLYPPLANKYQVYGGAFFQGPTSTLKTGMFTGGDYNPNGLTEFYRGGPFDAVHANSFIGHLTYDLSPDVTIKSITTYRQSRETDYTTLVDAPVDPYQQYNDQPTKTLTEEINLTGKAMGNRLHYVGGFYYYNQDSHSLQFDGTDYCDPAGWNDVEIDKERSYAVYGQVDFDLTSKLQLEVGGRYTNDWKSALGSITAWKENGIKAVGCGTSIAAFQGGVGKCANTLTVPGTASWTEFNPEGAVTYKITPDINAYATIRSSYDQGGFNAHALKPGVTPLVPFQPDHFVDYEVGLKTEWFDHTLRVDANYYYEEYTELTTTVPLTVNGISTRVTQNVGNAHYDGFEGTLDWAPTKDFHLGINGSLFQASYETLSPAALGIGLRLNTPIAGTTNAGPAFNWSVNGSYIFHPYKEALLTVSMNYKAQAATLGCQSSQLPGAASATNPLIYGCTVPAYGLLGGNAYFQLAPDSPWTIGAYVTNLLDTYWLVGRNTVNPFNPGSMGINSDSPGAPREFGMIIKRTF